MVMNPDSRLGIFIFVWDERRRRRLTLLKNCDMGRLQPSVRDAAQRKSSAITSVRLASEWRMGSVSKVFKR
ncbi:hypothetical protein PHMEG_00021008 [Phytophthora megakarya]|uniref:Uncharacterized protein n=1 Tax=Phytophthora megakarya TaxID=4795 RepID=A0A225VMR5_9STRA|nr:hypothetical protein PHMEG_00021008 [Phytophthora megakarya]